MLRFSADADAISLMLHDAALRCFSPCLFADYYGSAQFFITILIFHA